jgi:hypothetical protein
LADHQASISVDFLTQNSGQLSAAAIDLWGKARPQLEKCVREYDRLDSYPQPAVPRFTRLTTWFGQSRSGFQHGRDDIVDAVLRVVKGSGAGEYREQIKELQQAAKDAHERIAECRTQLVSARPQASVFSSQSAGAESVEELKESIAAEERTIDDLRRQITDLRECFRCALQQIGIEVFEDEIDYLLMPVTQDDFVSMSAVVANLATLTSHLERLTEETRGLPAHTRRYYGMYLLLVYSVDRVQTRFMEEIDDVHVPKLRAFELEARQNITDARHQISGGGPKEQLKANVEAAKLTIEACRSLANMLRDQRNSIAGENRHTKLMLNAALNTYKTIRLSMDVAGLMSDCREAFGALRQLQVPRLRTLQNVQLKAELQRLTERMREEEE